MVRNGSPRVCLFFFPRNRSLSCFLFREIRKEYIFDLRNGAPSCFLFRGRVRNGIPRVSIPRNSRNSVGNNYLFRLFRLPRNYFFDGNSQLLRIKYMKIGRILSVNTEKICISEHLNIFFYCTVHYMHHCTWSLFIPFYKDWDGSQGIFHLKLPRSN